MNRYSTVAEAFGSRMKILKLFLRDVVRENVREAIEKRWTYGFWKYIKDNDGYVERGCDRSSFDLISAVTQEFLDAYNYSTEIAQTCSGRLTIREEELLHKLEKIALEALNIIDGTIGLKNLDALYDQTVKQWEEEESGRKRNSDNIIEKLGNISKTKPMFDADSITEFGKNYQTQWYPDTNNEACISEGTTLKDSLDRVARRLKEMKTEFDSNKHTYDDGI